MNGVDVFTAAFLVALAIVLAEQLRKHVLDPGLRALVDALLHLVARRVSVATLTPTQAVQRYVAGGMDPARGMPTLAELQWLTLCAPAERFAWAQGVVSVFEQTLGPAKQYDFSLDDLGPLRQETVDYLSNVSGGYPIVGTWRWTRS